jgi:hypothetical protein
VVISKIDYELASKARKLHRALAHPSDVVLCNLIANNVILNVPITERDVRNANSMFGECTACIQAKSHKDKTTNPSAPIASSIGESVSTDLIFIGGFTFMLLTDQKSKLVNAVHMLDKSAASFHKALTQVSDLYSKYDHKLSTLRSDREKGLVSLLSDGRASRLGVDILFKSAEQHEGLAERTNRTVSERVRAILHSLPYV